MEQPNILLIDDDISVLKAAQLFLKREGYAVFVADKPELIPTLMKKHKFDAILLDMNFTRNVSSGNEGFSWLKKILQLDASAVVILITAYGDVDTAVKAIREGATDFIQKPWQNQKLLATLSAAMQLRKSRLQVADLLSKQQHLTDDINSKYPDLLGESPAIKGVFTTIQKIAKTDANVLILGENGTGKELVARALHKYSERAAQPFVSVDMGAISENLFESELFGHVKGAFTDAKEDRMGRFEVAHKGSLFLDEIGNLSITLQAKLLTALQNRQVTKVGSNKSKEVDIRLICATNMPLYDMVAEKKFRQDLLYRINTVEIRIPPLRDRKEDIGLLAEHYTQMYSKKYRKNITGISKEAIKRLEHYSWPGNVRELQHSIERAVIMSENTVLKGEDFFFSSMASPAGSEMNNNLNLDDLEKKAIQKSLSRNAGNISKAAEELGLTRASLYRRIEKHGI